MNKKSKNIMSLSIEPEMQDHIKKIADKRNISVSKLLRDLVDKYLPEDDTGVEVDTVILKIPRELRQNSTKLKEWIDARLTGIVKALSN